MAGPQMGRMNVSKRLCRLLTVWIWQVFWITLGPVLASSRYCGIARDRARRLGANSVGPVPVRAPSEQSTASAPTRAPSAATRLSRGAHGLRPR